MYCVFRQTQILAICKVCIFDKCKSLYATLLLWIMQIRDTQVNFVEESNWNNSCQKCANSGLSMKCRNMCIASYLDWIKFKTTSLQRRKS